MSDNPTIPRKVPRPKRAEIFIAVAVAVVVLVVVAGSAGAQSAGHMYDWASLNGEPHWRSLLFPVSVDGAIVASTVVLYVDHRLNRPGHRLAYGLLSVGLLISVVANVIHDVQGQVAAKAISAVGPLALFGIFHLIMQFVRSLAGVFAWASETDETPSQVAAVAQEAAPIVTVVDQTTTVRPRAGVQRRRKRTGHLAGRRRTIPAPVAVVTPIRPTPAPVPPRPQTAPETPGQQPAKHRQGRRKTATAANTITPQEHERAFQLWQSTKGSASAQQIGDLIGRSKATGYRLQQQFKETTA